MRDFENGYHIQAYFQKVFQCFYPYVCLWVCVFGNILSAMYLFS